MNFIACETRQKLRGGYYTQPDIAMFLTEWALEIRPRRILEPACGDGIFFDSLARLQPKNFEFVVGCEIDPGEAKKAEERGHGLKGSFKVMVGDFLAWSLSRGRFPTEFDAVLGNPPFIRYQYLDSELQARAERIFRNFDLPFTKHTNAWVPFIIASLAMLRAGGRLAMVVPSELLHVIHARPLRHFLLKSCSHVFLIDPEDIWFDDTLQGVMLLLAQKRGSNEKGTSQVAITAVHSRGVLKRPAREYFERADFFPASVLNGKWMLGLLNRSERSLVAQSSKHPRICAFRDVASVDVGIVTGANKFFHVSDDIVRQFGLEKWAHPMFGRSEHVKGIVYSKKDHRENRRHGLPTNFLWFDNSFFETLTDSAKKYIRQGESQGLPKRYKCRVREPWYTVPSVYKSPVGMLKRSHHFPRLVLNTAKAFTTDTAYRVIPGKAMMAADLVLSFVNSLTALSAELEGRHYGGGVLELVPSEIECTLVPMIRAKLDELAKLDKAVRASYQPEELLAKQDSVVLRPLGFCKQDSTRLLSAWDRLRKRRQRVPTELETSDAED
jgi:adenine-specific DNA methylase